MTTTSRVTFVNLVERLLFWQEELQVAEDYESSDGGDDADGMTEASNMVHAYETVLKDLSST